MSALPFLSFFVLDVPHRVHVLNTNGRCKPHLLTVRASNNYILLVALAVAHVHEILFLRPSALTRPRNPNHPLPSRQANSLLSERAGGDEVYVRSLHSLRTPVNEEREMVVRATMNRTQQEGPSGMRADVKIGGG